MPKTVYSWRCQMDVPMLDEDEWRDVLPRFDTMRARVQGEGLTVGEAKDALYGQGALDRYFELTGFRETNPNALWHHRLSQLGPSCRACGKPLRTARAKFCAECGTPKMP